LQGQRVLGGVVAQETLGVVVQQGTGVTISVYSRVFLESRRRKNRQWRSVQSIIGATLKRREGSERVVAGLEPGFVVISFNVSCTKFSSFEGVCSKPRNST